MGASATDARRRRASGAAIDEVAACVADDGLVAGARPRSGAAVRANAVHHARRARHRVLPVPAAAADLRHGAVAPSGARPARAGAPAARTNVGTCAPRGRPAAARVAYLRLIDAAAPRLGHAIRASVVHARIGASGERLPIAAGVARFAHVAVAARASRRADAATTSAAANVGARRRAHPLPVSVARLGHLAVALRGALSADSADAGPHADHGARGVVAKDAVRSAGLRRFAIALSGPRLAPSGAGTARANEGTRRPLAQPTTVGVALLRLVAGTRHRIGYTVATLTAAKTRARTGGARLPLSVGGARLRHLEVAPPLPG